MQELRVDTKKAVKEMNALIDKFVKFKKEITGTAGQASAGFKKIETSIVGLKKASNDLMVQYIKLDKSFKNVTKSQKSFVTQTRNLKIQLKETRAQLASVNAQMDKMRAKSKGGFFSGILRGTQSLIAAFGILSGVMLFTRAIQNAFLLTKQLDSMAFAMKAVITEAVELAQTELWLKQITADFGAELITTTNRYIKFRAAANQAGLTAKETQEIFGTMTKAAGVLGLRTDELTGVYLALEQMISKGKITTEELRRQLGERLPGAMDIMANSLKVTTAELDDMMKKGTIITKEVLPGFAKQVEIAFGLKKIRRVDTLQAATIRLKNAWTILVEDFKKGNDASEKLTEVFDLLAENLANVMELGYELIKMWVLYKVAMQYTIVNTRLLALVNTLLSASFYRNIIAVVAHKAMLISLNIAALGLIGTLRLLWATLLAHPLGILIAIVAGLMWAFRDLNEDILKTSDAINKLSAKNRDLTKSNFELEGSLKDLIDRYKQLKDATNELTTDEQSELKNIIEDIGKAIPQAVLGVDEFNRALDISIDRADDLLANMQKLTRLQADAGLEIQEKNIIDMEKAVASLNTVFGATIDGIGQVVVGSDGLPKIFTALAAPLKDLDKQQTLLFHNWLSGMKSNIAESKNMVIALEEIAYGRDKDNTRMKLQIQHMEQLERIFGRQTDEMKFTIDWYKVQIKILKDEIESTALTNKDAKPNLILIDKYKKAIDEILGINRGRVKQLRIIKDLLKDIENTQMKQQVMRLDIIGDDIKVNLEERENALFKSALTQVAIERNIKDMKQELNLAQFEKDKKKIEEELKLHQIGSTRRIELERHLAALKEELRQKDTIAEELFANKIFTINNNLRKRLETINKARRENIFSGLDNDANLRIIALNKVYEEERQLSENRITLAKEIFESSKKTSADLRKLNRVVANEHTSQAEEFKKLEIEKAEIAKEAAREIIKAQILLAEGDLIGLDADKQADEIIRLTQLINKLKAALKQLEAPVVIDIDLELEKIAQVVDHVKGIVNEIGGIFNAFAEARIENIEAEIQSERDRYQILIDLAKDDVAQREALEDEKNAKLRELEKKRLRAEQRQAKLRKAFALADIAMNTASAIVSIWAQVPKFDFGISAGLLTAFVSALGAAQIATVLATPIPQYAEGSDGKIKEHHKGMINDAGVQEYIVRDGSILTTKQKDAVVDLKPGDEIHKDFSSLMKSAVLMNSFAGGTEIDEQSFNYFFKGISRSLEDGLSKAKFVNNIKLNNNAKNDQYGNSLSKWNN